MPLARITTPLPEYFERLAQDLRARGFDIETASPGQFFPTAADLEVTIRQCKPEEASRLAADAAASKDMCVLMSPGAKEGRIRSVEMIVLQPAVEAVEAARHRLTPAQVIEISSALVANGALPPEAPTAVEVKPSRWSKARAGAHSSWQEIAKTTTHWTESVVTNCHAGWSGLRNVFVPVKAFLLEIAEETRELARRAGDGMFFRKRKITVDDEEQLVPSMFSLSDEENQISQIPVEDAVIDISEHPSRAPRISEKRFLKASATAALAAVAVLLAVTMMPRANRGPVTHTEKPDDTPKSLISPILKPSPMVEHEGQTAASSMRVLTAKQVVRDDEVQDRVVRFAHTAPAPKHEAPRPRIKRYSDLD